jgi:hypothetical protein
MRVPAFLMPLVMAGCAGYLPVEVGDVPMGTGSFGEAELTTYLFMSGDRVDPGNLVFLWHKPLDDVLHLELERHRYFSRLYYQKGPAVPLKLHVSMSKTQTRDTSGELGGVIAIAGTGGIVPKRVDWLYEARFTLRCNGEEIGKWSYELRAAELINIWGPTVAGKDIDERAVVSFVPRFLRDVVESGLAPGNCR